MSDVLMETRKLTKMFPVRRGTFGQHRYRLVAVEDVDLEIHVGETVGLVGESGCGKSTLGLTAMQLYVPTRGSVLLDGVDLTTCSASQLAKARKRMQMVFQDPFASLDPRLTVQEIIAEPMDINKVGSKHERRQEASRLLEVVGLPGNAGDRFPNEFSGGQQQRIGVARALSLQPKLLICDEPVSALDVSVQAQILNLLKDLQESLSLAYIFISHNIAVTAFMADRIGVMYLGRIVELGTSDEIVSDPLHPYTRALISSVPIAEVEGRRERLKLKGEVPSPTNRPSGCSFHNRCLLAQDICSRERPELQRLRGREVACHMVS